jgi:hypothetical protein
MTDNYEGTTMIKVYITRKYTAGNLNGLCYNDVVEFQDVETAQSWATHVTARAESLIGSSKIVAA